MTEKIVIDDLIQAHDLVVEVAKVEGAINSTYEMLQDTLRLSSKTAVDTWARDRKRALLEYMLAHRSEPIDAAEIGVAAVIKGRQSGARFDLPRLMEVPGGSDAILEAARLGYLTVNDKMLQAYRKATVGSAWADALQRVRDDHGRDEWVELKWTER